MTVTHKDLTGTELHVPGYMQSTDPGAVGAGKYWIDTSGGTGNWAVKVRNSSDDGWETVASGGGAGGLEPESYWGGNLVKNYPSLEGADGAQPEWWEEEDANVTLTEEDTTGETIPQKHERVLKVVNGVSGGGKYIYQRYVFADEPTLDDSVSVVSAGCWVYTPSAGTVTLELYDVGGAASLGTATTTTTSSWVWLEVLNKTLGTTSLDIRIKHSADSATLYVAMPTLNVGATVRPWKERGLRYVLEFGGTVLNINPATTAWTSLDLTASTSPLTVAVSLSIMIRTTSTGLYIAYIRPGGSAQGQTYDAAVLREGSGNVVGQYPGQLTSFFLCDDGQVIEHSVNTTGVLNLTLGLRGRWDWKS